jgi:hypothetical protein
MPAEKLPPADGPKQSASTAPRSSVGPLAVVFAAVLLFIFGPRLLDVLRTGHFREEIKNVCGYIPGGEIMNNARAQCAECVKSRGQWERLYGGSAADLLRAGYCRRSASAPTR